MAKKIGYEVGLSTLNECRFTWRLMPNQKGSVHLRRLSVRKKPHLESCMGQNTVYLMWIIGTLGNRKHKTTFTSSKKKCEAEWCRGPGAAQLSLSPYSHAVCKNVGWGWNGIGREVEMVQRSPLTCCLPPLILYYHCLFCSDGRGCWVATKWDEDKSE